MPSIARKPSTMHNLSRTSCFFPSWEMQYYFRATYSFRSRTETSRQVKPSLFLLQNISCQKQQVTNSFIFSFFLQIFTGFDSVAMELNLSCLSISFSRSARGSSTLIVDWLALTVDVETDGSYSTLGFLLNSFSHRSLSKKEPLSLSAKFSAQSELNDFFCFSALPLQTKTDTNCSFSQKRFNQSCSMYCVIK